MDNVHYHTDDSSNAAIKTVFQPQSQALSYLPDNRSAADDFVGLATVPVDVDVDVGVEELSVSDACPLCEAVVVGQTGGVLDASVVVSPIPCVYVIKLVHTLVVELEAASPCTRGIVTPGHFAAQSL